MKQQHGMILIFSLMVLLVLTLLSVTAMGNAFTSQRIAHNDFNHKVAFQAAEASVNEAERLIDHMEWQDDFEKKLNAGRGFYLNGQLETDLFNHNHWQTGVNCIASTHQLNQMTRSGCVKIQLIERQLPLQIGDYDTPPVIELVTQITARGLDNSGHSSSIIQTHYRSYTHQ